MKVPFGHRDSPTTVLIEVPEPLPPTYRIPCPANIKLEESEPNRIAVFEKAIFLVGTGTFWSSTPGIEVEGYVFKEWQDTP